ncbi:DUF952 domain-containing protein [Gammaproteobacteria bacterium]|nr:DUF952 domain-containing protein [Gammaproteobacteria bacterium]MDB2666466.1 DUF952 domain-containing protein [Gammaproteobacteria bacterium]MDB9842095.1 DUF952 domain-containing protein [Gammaproteobacteria bacterium]MDC1141138.1 DUF952 domain-containing protein [Gammaproteobacteria bacterium]
MTDVTANKVYKVLTLGEWEESSKIGQIVTARDQQDGFVHLSSAKQLNMTLSLYFLKEEKVILLQINEGDIIEGLTYEYADKRGGEFAHFYGELSTDKISQSWHLDRSAFSLPEEVMLEAEQN